MKAGFNILQGSIATFMRFGGI